MNVVKEIHRINERELETGGAGSWHDQYKDSAYIYVGGLPYQLTEGDVIAIFSQYGEVVDISMPRDQTTQKLKGFAFLMYADQRSTVLAVDNLGGSKVLERTLKVDHVLNYKQLEKDNETGKMVERDSQRLAAHPDKFRAALPDAAESDDGGDSDSSHPSIDLDDPMRDYLIEQRRAAKKAGSGGASSSSKKRKHDGESKEERKARREKKRLAKEKKLVGNASGKDRERSRDKPRVKDEGSTTRRREPDDARSHTRSERDRRDEDRRMDDRRYDRREDEGRDRPRDRDRERDREDRARGGMSAFADLEKWAKGGS